MHELTNLIPSFRAVMMGEIGKHRLIKGASRRQRQSASDSSLATPLGLNAHPPGLVRLAQVEPRGVGEVSSSFLQLLARLRSTGGSGEDSERNSLINKL